MVVRFAYQFEKRKVLIKCKNLKDYYHYPDKVFISKELTLQEREIEKSFEKTLKKFLVYIWILPKHLIVSPFFSAYQAQETWCRLFSPEAPPLISY